MRWEEPDRSQEGLAATLRTRAALLEALDGTPTGKAALRDELGSSRSTVYKGVRELVGQGLAAETESGYELTALGRLARREHAAYNDRLHHLSETQAVLADLPASMDPPIDALAGATTATTDPYAPERPLAAFDAATEDTDHVRSLSPVAIPRYLEPLHEAVEAGRRRELVVESPAVAALADGYDDFGDALAAGLDVYALDESLPFGLTLADETVAVTTYDEGGVSGILVAEGDDACAWAEETYESYHERGERVDSLASVPAGDAS